jgi:hypothetical protein
VSCTLELFGEGGPGSAGGYEPTLGDAIRAGFLRWAPRVATAASTQGQTTTSKIFVDRQEGATMSKIYSSGKRRS